MGSGSWGESTGAGALPGDSPTHPDAFSLYYQGWVTPTSRRSPTTSRSTGTGPAASAPTRTASTGCSASTAGDGEYFLLENRHPAGLRRLDSRAAASSSTGSTRPSHRATAPTPTRTTRWSRCIAGRRSRGAATTASTAATPATPTRAPPTTTSSTTPRPRTRSSTTARRPTWTSTSTRERLRGHDARGRDAAWASRHRRRSRRPTTTSRTPSRSPGDSGRRQPVDGARHRASPASPSRPARAGVGLVPLDGSGQRQRDITTTGSDYDTVLGLYTGSAVNALTEVAANDDENSRGRDLHQQGRRPRHRRHDVPDRGRRLRRRQR